MTTPANAGRPSDSRPSEPRPDTLIHETDTDRILEYQGDGVWRDADPVAWLREEAG